MLGGACGGDRIALMMSFGTLVSLSANITIFSTPNVDFMVIQFSKSGSIFTKIYLGKTGDICFDFSFLF